MAEATLNSNDSSLSKLDKKWLLSPKFIYFGVSSLYYAFYVYRMPFYKEYLGLTIDRSGYVQAAWNLASFLGVATWGNIADSLKIHRGVLMFICLALGGVFQLGWLKNIIGKDYSFYISLFTFSIYGFFVGGLLPLVDDQILKLLKYQFGKETKLYGRQALFGMVAYGLVTFSIGQILDKVGVVALLWIVPVIAVPSAITVGIFGYTKSDQSDCGSSSKLSSSTQGLSREEEEEEEEEKKFSSNNSMKKPMVVLSFLDYVRKLAQPRFAQLLLAILGTGLGRQTLALFLPLYLKEELGLTDGQVGNAYLSSALFSVLFFFAAPHGLERLGIKLMLMIGQMALILRLGVYAIFHPTPTVVLLVELMNGMAYSFTHLAAVKEADECAALGWEATFQAAYSCVHVQFPAVFCSLFGGIVYRKYGGQVLLTIALAPPIISFVFTASLLVIEKFRRTSFS